MTLLRIDARSALPALAVLGALSLPAEAAQAVRHHIFGLPPEAPYVVVSRGVVVEPQVLTSPAGTLSFDADATTGIEAVPLLLMIDPPYSFVGPFRILVPEQGRGAIDRIEVRSDRGALVRSIDPDRSGKRRPLVWDGRDDAGRLSPLGRYLVRVSAGGIESAGWVEFAW